MDSFWREASAKSVGNVLLMSLALCNTVGFTKERIRRNIKRGGCIFAESSGLVPIEMESYYLKWQTNDISFNSSDFSRFFPHAENWLLIIDSFLHCSSVKKSDIFFIWLSYFIIYFCWPLTMFINLILRDTSCARIIIVGLGAKKITLSMLMVVSWRPNIEMQLSFFLSHPEMVPFCCNAPSATKTPGWAVL